MLRNNDDFAMSGLHDRMSLAFYECKNILKYIGHDDATLPFHVELEVPITDLRGYVVGYWDAVVYVKMDLLEERHCWEFKPFIKSMGETIRQIQRYWQYPVRGYYRKICGSPTRVYLWTRDPRYGSVFEGHGIKTFVKKVDIDTALKMHPQDLANGDIADDYREYHKKRSVD